MRAATASERLDAVATTLDMLAQPSFAVGARSVRAPTPIVGWDEKPEPDERVTAAAAAATVAAEDVVVTVRTRLR